MNNPYLIEQSWRGFAEEIDLSDAPEIQRREMRRAFYGGAVALFHLLNKIMDPSTLEPTEMDMEIVSHINAEFEKYVEDLLAGRA